MTPIEFESAHESAWRELEAMLGVAERERVADRFLTLYRMCCEHLALAQARDFPEHVVARLARLTAAAHQIIYRQSDFGLRRILTTLLELGGAPRSRGPAAYGTDSRRWTGTGTAMWGTSSYYFWPVRE